jgi:hydroxymethylglutaryl-CoA lyase
MTYPDKVIISEVSPRDGLQNEARFVPSDAKVAFIDALSDSGLTEIEVTSFVSRRAIPQLADAEEVFSQIKKTTGLRYSALIPNEQGMKNAIRSGVKHVALFTAASEQFNQRNINCSIKESIERFRPVVSLAKAHNIGIRAYISCVLGCPYEGRIQPKQVIDVIRQLQDMDIQEFSFGDTIGVGTVKQTSQLLDSVLKILSPEQMVMHFHDTYGQAIANIHASLTYGIYHFDSSVAGLGGCPYARGASGNVATEDVLYLMHGLGISTGVDIYKLVEAGHKMCKLLGRKNQSKVANALLANT